MFAYGRKDILLLSVVIILHRSYYWESRGRCGAFYHQYQCL